MAKSVVQVAQVQEDQIVLLTSDPPNFPFLEDLAVAVRAAGAFPLTWVTSDNYNQRMYSDVPAKYGSQSPLLLLGLYKMIDTQINVDFGGDPDYNFFAAADQNRLAAQSKASAPALQLFLSGHRRYVEVGNGIFPNPPTDISFGVKGTRFIVSAGSIGADCAGVNCYTALPAGDLFVIPVPGTATGKIVFDNTFWGKDDLKGFTATFSAAVTHFRSLISA